jgi:Flp pilus assembly protein TadG
MGGSMKTKQLSSMWSRLRNSVAALRRDCRGLAATEFAMVVPVMLVLFFGTDEFATGVAVNRKVTLMARTLSDLTSQNISVVDTQLTNFFNASAAIMTPYSATPVKSTITELYVDPSTLAARVQWSKGSVPRTVGTTVVIPPALQVGGTYLIYSEVSYAFVPTVGYVLKNSITLSDFTFTRPRQSTCVIYPTPAAGTPLPPCPTS